MRYTVVIEDELKGWGDQVQDLAGCIAAGENKTEVLRLFKEAARARAISAR